jgi:hypothetical protein
MDDFTDGFGSGGDDPFGEENAQESETVTEDDTLETSDQSDATVTFDSKNLDEGEEVSFDEELEEEDRVSVFADLMEKLDEGDRSNQIAYRDRMMVVIGDALDEDEQLREELADDLGEALDREIDAEEMNRAVVGRALVRVGLQEVAPDVYDDLGEAKAELARRSL